MDITVSPRGAKVVLAALLSVVAVIVGVSFVIHAHPYLPDSALSPILAAVQGGSEGIAWLGVDEEQSIPAWFSSSLLLLSALVLVGIAMKSWHRRYGRHWLVLAAIFVLLSIDETVSFHERAIVPIRQALGTEGLLYYAWVVPGAVFVVVVALVYARFVAALPRRTRVLVLVSGALYVGGAIGMETLSANHAEEAGQRNLPYVSFSTIEELLEMTGVVVFVYALITYRIPDRADQPELSRTDR